MSEEIQHLYNHLCFPRTLQKSSYGTKDTTYYECSEKKDNPGVLFLFTRHVTNDKETGKYHASNLHWVRVEVCPFCKYKPDDKGEG